MYELQVLYYRIENQIMFTYVQAIRREGEDNTEQSENCGKKIPDQNTYQRETILIIDISVLFLLQTFEILCKNHTKAH